MDAEPTAKKLNGFQKWAPAVMTASGPKVLPHGQTWLTRYMAVEQAKKLIAEAQEGKGE